MSLTFHHFKKDFAFLLPLWRLWITLLLVELVIDLEWIAPIAAPHSPFQFTFNWTLIIRAAVWLLLIVLAVRYPNEDARESDRSFIAVRPLPVHSYWLARCMVFGLLLILPLALQEGLYLIASDRPTAEILSGMGIRAFFATAAILWLLPMPLLATGNARYALPGAAMLTTIIVRSLYESRLASKTQFHSFFFYNIESMAQAATIGAAAIIAFAWWQRGRGWSPRHRGIVMAILTTASYGLVFTPWVQPWSWKPNFPDQTADLQARYPLLPNPVKTHFRPVSDVTGENKALAEASLAALKIPDSWMPGWTLRQVHSDTLRPNALPTFSGKSFFIHQAFLSYYNCIHSKLHLPGNTFQVGSSIENRHQKLDLGIHGVPENLSVPIDLSADFKANWFQLDIASQTSLHVGEVSTSPDIHLEILDTKKHRTALDQPSLGEITVTFRYSIQSNHIQNSFSSYEFYLHSPAIGLVWAPASAYPAPARAVGRAWERHLSHISFRDVLIPSTGITEETLHQLQLIAVRVTYVGESNHRLELKDQTLGESFHPNQGILYTSNPRVSGNPRESFHQEFKRLRKPPPNASREEAARYLAHVLTLAETLRQRGNVNLDQKPIHPGDDLAIADELVPLVLAHPDVITSNLSRSYGNANDRNQLLRQMLEAALLHIFSDRLSRRHDGLWLKSQGDGQEIRLPLQALISGRLPWKNHIHLIEQALRERTLEPLLELQRLWLNLEQQTFSHEEILANLTSNPTPSWLLRLKDQDPAIAEKARSIVLQAYQTLAAPVTWIPSEQRSLVETALFAGSATALEQALWHLKLNFNHEHSDKKDLLAWLSILSRAMGGKPQTSESYPDFLQSLMPLRASHFQYDTASMTWQLKTTP